MSMVYYGIPIFALSEEGEVNQTIEVCVFYSVFTFSSNVRKNH